MNKQELKEFNSHQSTIAGLSMFSMAFIPAQLVVYFSVRNKPAEMKQMLIKSTVLFAFTGISFMICGKMQDRFLTQVSDKYLKGLSDF